MQIKTERLILRDFTDQDYDLLLSFRNDPDIARYMHWNNSSNEDTKYWFDLFLKDIHKRERSYYHFFIEIEKTKKVIGEVGLNIVSKNDSGGIAIIGFYLLKDYWGNGYITESAQKIIEFGFNDLGLHKISANCEKINKRSIAVMKRLGMKHEATFRKEVFVDSNWQDIEIYAILK